MLKFLRPSAPREARREPLTHWVRWTLALLVSVSVVVPGAALAGSRCSMQTDGSGCPRCEAKMAAHPATASRSEAAASEAAPSCHSRPEMKAEGSSCHDESGAGECCSLEKHEAAAALFGGAESLAPSSAPTLSAPAADAAGTRLPLPALTKAPASESPPGTSGLLIAQNTILRL